jgi:hypothetical protein
VPSSLIFVGLVVVWLLILVPAVARRQQEVARPSEAALAGRVLARPVRHRIQEVDQMDESDIPTESRAARADTTRPEPAQAAAARVPTARVPVAAGARTSAARAEEDVLARPDHGDTDRTEDRDLHGEPDDELELDAHDGEPEEEPAGSRGVDPAERPGDAEEREWQRPPARYRPGRGGFDAEAAALTARARYAFRQRVVIGLLVGAVATALIAVIALPALWWPHALIDVSLVSYLVYLRRQVRMEEAIRERRAARMAGTRRPSAADDPELDDWARRGKEAAARAQDDGYAGYYDYDESDVSAADVDEDRSDDEADDEAWTTDDVTPERVRGTGEPIGVLPARRRTARSDDEDPAGAEVESALPRLQPAPPPPLPAGTQLVDVDEEEDGLVTDAGTGANAYRRAAGE